jgi:hypothetical protein
MPMEPARAAARSDRMSACYAVVSACSTRCTCTGEEDNTKLVATMVSSDCGSRTMRQVIASSGSADV